MNKFYKLIYAIICKITEKKIENRYETKIFEEAQFFYTTVEPV